MKIHVEIILALAECDVLTGGNATRIYLGQLQIDRLMLWEKETQHTSDTNTSDTKLRDGNNRLEFMGYPVYEVNAENHCFAA